MGSRVPCARAITKCAAIAGPAKGQQGGSQFRRQRRAEDATLTRVSAVRRRGPRHGSLNRLCHLGRRSQSGQQPRGGPLGLSRFPRFDRPLREDRAYKRHVGCPRTAWNYQEGGPACITVAACSEYRDRLARGRQNGRYFGQRPGDCRGDLVPPALLRRLPVRPAVRQGQPRRGLLVGRLDPALLLGTSSRRGLPRAPVADTRPRRCCSSRPS